MPRSVSIIDYKVSQADFFLCRINEVGYDFFAAQCYCDAFTSSCRSITFAIQAVCNNITGFNDWYNQEQRIMKNDPIMRFFHDYRTISNHIGDTPILSGSTDHDYPGTMKLFFVPSEDLPKVPEEDVYSSCVTYFKKVLDIVYRLYVLFATDLDARWYYTKEHFDNLGLSIEDAEEALGFPRGWTKICGTESELKERWLLIRRTQAIGPTIQDIFQRYLEQIVEGPDDKLN